MEQSVFYKLADIVVKVKFDFVFFSEISFMKDFMIPEQDAYDWEIVFERVDSLDAYLGEDGEFVDSYFQYQYYQNKGREYCFFKHGQYLHAVTFNEGNVTKCCYVSQQWLRDITSSGFQLENFFCLENIFQKFDGMMLHSCHIQHGGEAILFSAPSGTGKSTQGDLWANHEGAKIVNGDRTLIRCVHNEWMAYGVPFCGTSGISLNEKASLKAIVVIRQAPYNKVSVLKGRDAFCALYSELTIHGWNEEYMEKALEWVERLMEKVPVLRLECTKDKEAVDVLKNYFEEMGGLYADC